ncbi:DUF2798 domain-containing protein [Acidovorax sp. Leaf78]|uniref:DUF2798 domain-containing protein n=1 Tax=unclassified Acidovorax TaxID=2684926 RepID=UPI0009EC98D2|nr:MAG: DUF2798 domain-containing protein [Acidovorax sp.]
MNQSSSPRTGSSAPAAGSAPPLSPASSSSAAAPSAPERSSKTFLGLRKLPARSATWVMPLLLSLLMTFIVSLISTLRVAGFTLDVLRLWMSSWALSWLVAFPTLLLVLPLVRRATAAIVDPQR